MPGQRGVFARLLQGLALVIPCGEQTVHFRVNVGILVPQAMVRHKGTLCKGSSIVTGAQVCVDLPL